MRKVALCVLTVGFVALPGTLLAQTRGADDTQAVTVGDDQAQANGIKITNNRRSVALDGPPRNSESLQDPTEDSAPQGFRSGVKVTNNRAVIYKGPPRLDEPFVPEDGTVSGTLREGIKITNNRSVITDDGPPRRSLEGKLRSGHALVVLLLELGQHTEAERQADRLSRLAPDSPAAISARLLVAAAR